MSGSQPEGLDQNFIVTASELARTDQGVFDLAQQVMAKKAKLREIIDRHGGVSAVAQKTGIPQPSLSGMLNSPSMPRRSTLYRIANALNLPEADIVSEWSR